MSAGKWVSGSARSGRARTRFADLFLLYCYHLRSAVIRFSHRLNFANVCQGRVANAAAENTPTS